MADSIIEDRTVYPTLITLAACLCTELETAGLPATCYCGIVAGDVALDFCAEGCGDGSCGGQAWVRIIDVFPSSTFPDQDSTLSNCYAPMAYNIEVGVARCAPMGELGGPNGYVPPSVMENVEGIRIQLADMAAMRRAIQCCFGSAERDYILGPYTQVDVNGGGCLGGTFVVTVWEEF